MAPTPQPNNGADSRDIGRQLEELGPPPIVYSIFTPFKGFEATAKSVPQSREEQLKAMIQSVKEQQAAVRNNIAKVYELRADWHVEKAKKETAAMIGDCGLYGDDLLENEKIQRASDAMFKACMGDAKIYEEKLARAGGNHNMIVPDARETIRDINNSIPEKTTRPTTVRGINQKLSSDIKNLVGEAVLELEQYDKRAAVSVTHYEQEQLKKEHVQRTVLNLSRMAPPQISPLQFSPPQISPPQISPPRIAPLPVGGKEQALDFARRLSNKMPNGMPIMGASTEPKKRKYESIEDVARR